MKLAFLIGRLRVWGLFLIIVPGCTFIPTFSGIEPIDPPAKLSVAPPNKNDAYIPVFVEVVSLQPTLRWEPFPSTKPDQPDFQLDQTKITSVTYDLKIWQQTAGTPWQWRQGEAGSEPGKLVYAREALLQNYHQLETPLEPSTNYFWTIRARFKYKGAERLTDWGAMIVASGRSFLPNLVAYFPFKTPEQ